LAKVQFADEEEEEYTKRAARFFKSVSVIATRHISIAAFEIPKWIFPELQELRQNVMPGRDCCFPSERRRKERRCPPRKVVSSDLHRCSARVLLKRLPTTPRHRRGKVTWSFGEI
jgi:hypothetical protein